MKTFCLGLLIGSLIPAAGIYAAGASSRSCLVYGMALVIVPALLGARKVAGWLQALANGIDAMRETKTPQRETKPGKSETKRTRAAPSIQEIGDPEVESALRNLGCDRETASRIASQVRGKGDLSERLRLAINLTRRAA